MAAQEPMPFDQKLWLGAAIAVILVTIIAIVASL